MHAKPASSVYAFNDIDQFDFQTNFLHDGAITAEKIKAPLEITVKTKAL